MKSDSRYMVDVEAYKLLHEETKTADAEEGALVFAEPGEAGYDDFLFQLPSTIHGFRMDDKTWGMDAESSRQ